MLTWGYYVRIVDSESEPIQYPLSKTCKIFFQSDTMVGGVDVNLLTDKNGDVAIIGKESINEVLILGQEVLDLDHDVIDFLDDDAVLDQIQYNHNIIEITDQKQYLSLQEFF